MMFHRNNREFENKLFYQAVVQKTRIIYNEKVFFIIILLNYFDLVSYV